MLKSILQYFLRVLSRKIIKKYKPDVIGITGSAGKTSAKEAIAIVLASRFNVRKSSKNYNNEFGVPLTIIGFEKSPASSFLGWFAVLLAAFKMLCIKEKNYPDMLVLEMGADKPGDIQYLIEIASCKVGVLTFISHAHTEFFKTIKKIAQEKRIIISHLRRDGFAVLNLDNEMVMQQIKTTKAEVMTYGFKEGADLQATDLNIIKDNNNWPAGINFKVIYKGNIVPVFLPGSITKPLVYAALAGLTVGIIFGVNLVEGAHALRELLPLPGHLTLISGIKNTLILDDTYNSSPEPSKAALEALNSFDIPFGSRKIVAFSDMLELGSETEISHREIGFKVAECGVDFLVTVGEAAKHIASAAMEAGLDENKIAKFSNSIVAGKFLQEKLMEGDVILVKGSQSMRMERVVKELMADPLKAKDLLVRQEKEWEV